MDIVLGEEKLDDSYTLSDVAYVFGWDRVSLNIYTYRIFIEFIDIEARVFKIIADDLNVVLFYTLYD